MVVVSIVTIVFAVAEAQPPAAAIKFVTVYVPALLADKSITPVVELIDKPAGNAENKPPLDKGGNTGLGSIPL